MGRKNKNQTIKIDVEALGAEGWQVARGAVRTDIMHSQVHGNKSRRAERRKRKVTDRQDVRDLKLEGYR